MLSDEEAEGIKEKLISHIESTFPEEQKISAINQVKSMNSEQLESFLEKNNLIKNSGEETEKEETGNCVFCAIASEKINSIKIDENDEAVAIFEINPVSRGHALIIPKDHESIDSKEAMILAKKVAKRIKEKLSPKDVEIAKSKMFGHEVINVLPIYKDENMKSKRKSAKIEELEEIKNELEKEDEKELPQPKIENIKEFLWLPKRIP